jgi:hypothetical protein
MAIPPPPNSGGGSTPSRGNSDILDAAWGLYAPTWGLFMLTTVLSASFTLKAPIVKGVGSLLLCGASMVILFLESKKQGCTGLRWRFDLKDWIQLALTVHALYFGLVHDVVSK